MKASDSSYLSSSSPSTSSNSSSSSVLSNQSTIIKRRKKNVKPEIEKKCSSDGSARRSSVYRGVTRHRWTGRFEAHLWDKFTWNNIQNKKGRQVYLGAYDCEETAARTYDLAALKYWGPDTSLNFSIEAYEKELQEMHNFSREEYLASLRRLSSGFSRGVSKYRGVARHHHNGRWEARIGRVLGNKYLYLGTFSTQEEAAKAYDVAAIRYRGASAITNFNFNNYSDYLKEDTILSDQSLHQLSDPNCQTNIEELAEEQKGEPELAMSQMTTPSYDSSSPSSSSIMAMIDDPLFNNDADNFCNWSLCLDTGFNPLPIPLEMMQPDEILPDLIYESGFEENIVDFLFDAGLDANEVNLS